MRWASAAVSVEGSDGRAMRLARLQTAVVMRALLAWPRKMTGGGCGRAMAAAGIRPRLGELQGDARGEGNNSASSRLGESGRKWPGGGWVCDPRLGDTPPIRAAGS